MVVDKLRREVMFNATIATANGAPTNRLASVQRGGTIDGIPTGISQTNTTVSYDANGNMINDGQHVYRYDALNRQVAVLLVDNTTKLEESVYNSSGERVGMVSYQGGAITGFTKFLRDGAAVVYEKSFTLSGSSHSNKSEKTYLYAAGRMAVTKDTNLVSGVSTYSYYGDDHLGTVRFSRTIDSNGNTVSGGDASYAFEPFGVMLPGSQPVNGNTHLYTGQERDALPDGSNMDYMHARYYGGNMGRFMRPDPGADFNLQSPQSWNLYSYVRGNPVNYNDPTGEVQFYVFDEKTADGKTDWTQNNPQLQQMLQAESDVEKQTGTEAGQAAKETLAPGNDVLIRPATDEETPAMGKALADTFPRGAAKYDDGKNSSYGWKKRADDDNKPPIEIRLNLKRLDALKSTGESLAPELGHELVHAKHAHDDINRYFDLHGRRDSYYGNKEEARTYPAEDALRRKLKATDPTKYANLPATHRELESKVYSEGIQ